VLLRRSNVIPILLLLLTSLPLVAAPLFPDAPSSHWASDALRSLAARGLVEGYPDGTFKGDRSVSRWELAQIVARLLARSEGEHKTFAGREDREVLSRLALSLQEELDTLGVRVSALEDGSTRLDRRITELERITFYGTLDARMMTQTFQNEGVSDNDSGRRGGGLPGGLTYINYEEAVGTVPPGLIRPQVNGVLPVMDYLRGRVLNNGVGFTSRALLGVNVDISPDLDAGLELVGFSSQGNQFIDGYWGLNAPYTAHVGSANPGDTSLPLNHQPFTRMVMDRFWLEHEPTQTKIEIGSITDLKITPLIYMGQNNANLEGPPRLNFGTAARGEIALPARQTLRWELFQSRIGTRNFFQQQNYDHQVYGADLRYSFDDKAGWLQLDYARIHDEAINGAPLNTGVLGFNNVAYGASTGWTPFQWVNPPGHFALQRSAFEQSQTSAAQIGLNTADTRPIPGWNGNQDNAVGVTAGGGNYGPQSQQTYGVEMGYDWEWGENDEVGVQLNYGHSDYRSNRNSSYTSRGDALRVALSGTALARELEFDLDYLRVDPNYGPTRFRNGLIGARFPSVFQVAGAFHAHDFVTYPFNRTGWRGELKWHFNERQGDVWIGGELFEQTRTSLYDVRVTPNALGQGIPTSPVIGFAPGFVDYVFAGYAHPALYGPLSANSFTPNLAPLEDNRGEQRRINLGARYRFEDPDISLKGEFRRYSYNRDSTLTPSQGGSQNLVDIDADTWYLELGWDLTDQHKVTLGSDIIKVTGHHDPGGLYNAYAARTQSIDFHNIDSTQTIPFLSFDWRPDEKTEWDFTVRRYDTTDGVSSSVTAGRAFDTVGSSIHPFEWSGWQLSSTYSLKF